MGNTSNFGFPFPEATNVPTVHLDLKSLGDSVDSELARRLGIFYDSITHGAASGVTSAGGGVSVMSKTYTPLFSVPYLAILISGGFVIGNVAGAEPSILAAISSETDVELKRREVRTKSASGTEGTTLQPVVTAIVPGGQGFKVSAAILNRSTTGAVSLAADSSSWSSVIALPLHIAYTTDPA